jgi:DNA-binding transcriptional MerR regulator
MRIYPLTECCALLRVNLKTLHKWLAQEGIHPQQSRADTRIRYLTAEQVATIAQAFDRPLPQREEPAADEPPASSPTALFRDCLNQQEERLLRLETEMRQVQASIASLQQQTSERTGVPGAAHLEQHPRQPQQSKKQKAGQKQPPRAKARAKTRSKKGRSKDLPGGLILLRVFAQQHRVPLKVAARASNAGKIAVVRGRWLINSRYATQALGTRGQHDFYTLFKERAGFIVTHGIKWPRWPSIALSLDSSNRFSRSTQ